jgi:hypothetical protein
MKRWIVRASLCLFLGAITTVAVAWGCAWLSPLFNGRGNHLGTSMVGIGISQSDFLTISGRHIHLRTGFPVRALDDARFLAPWQTARDRLVFPQSIIWPGFVIDTLFYAAIWFGVFFGFASAKRAIRRASGRCPMCGYDLRGALDAGCPECGWNRKESAA